MNMTISIFSFFSGSGFLDLGFERPLDEGDNPQQVAHVRTVNEFDPAFERAYKYGRERLGIDLSHTEFLGGSAEEMLPGGRHSERLATAMEEGRGAGEITGFLGGPPCPDFSIAGKQAGEHGDNGRLTRSYFELVRIHRPAFFLFENVKGLYRTKVHRAFYEGQKLALEEAGYVMTERLVNAIEYGAPQDRDRIILIGLHTDHLAAQFGIAGVNAEVRRAVDAAMDWHRYSPTWHHFGGSPLKLPWPDTHAFEEHGTRHVEMTPEQQALTVSHWWARNDVDNHPNADDAFTPRAALPKFQSIQEGDDSKKSYKRLHRHRYSPTAAYGNNEVHLHPYRARRLSAAEVLAIQTLPSAFSFPSDMSLTDMFKTAGNGVPYVMARGLARALIDLLTTQDIPHAMGVQQQTPGPQRVGQPFLFEMA